MRRLLSLAALLALAAPLTEAMGPSPFSGDIHDKAREKARRLRQMARNERTRAHRINALYSRLIQTWCINCPLSGCCLSCRQKRDALYGQIAHLLCLGGAL